jgi:hypothetical protein
MTAFARIGDTGEHNLGELEERLTVIYPGQAFSVFSTPDLPAEVAKIINDNGFSVTVEDGDQFEKCQWLKVVDDFELPELEEDCSDEEWKAREELEQKLSELRQEYADALGQELLA